MADRFFTQTTCDRCGGSLQDGRMMSMYNTDCICMKCMAEETKRHDYRRAVEAGHEHIRHGDYNFKGIGLS